VETPEQKKERKRLKKLEKMVTTVTTTDETPEQKKERKRLKKLVKIAKLKKESPSTSDTESTGSEDSKKENKKEGDKPKKDKKKKEAKKPDIVTSWYDQVVAESETTETPIKVKKNKKKRKENNNESDSEEPAKKKVKAENGETEEKAEKKSKKEKMFNGKPVVEAEIEKETGTFKKIFYRPSENTNNMPTDEVAEFQKEHRMNVTGRAAETYKPIKDFKEFQIDERAMKVCEKFDKPTPIQSQCWPIIASGRDIIGIAETGSGKTLAFSLPALAHMLHRIENQPEGVPWGPTMLVLAPTRELAMQSQEVLEEAGKTSGIRSVCCYGGVPKWDQKRALRWGVEVVVATPGRLKDLCNMGCVNLKSVSYLVLDEADRMLDQGFEDDIRQIIGMTHPERQTCLFSATWPEAIRNLAHEFLTDPIKVTIGSDELTANKKIKQIVEVVEDRDKDDKFYKLLDTYTTKEEFKKILIFVLKKRDCHELEQTLMKMGWYVGSIHGDKDQYQRSKALENFKSGRCPILVATDVAARGLDIPNVEYVINYSFPLTIEDYVHRIGRTGRAGKDGTAFSFFTYGDRNNAGTLVKILQDAEQEVPKEMYKFNLRIKASQYNKFFAKEGDNGMRGNSYPNIPGRGNCFKCGEAGHMSRACPQGGASSFSGGRGGARGGGNSSGCFKCGEQGHMSRECPQGGAGGGNQSGCFKCGEQGHMSRECPQNPKGGNRPTFNPSASGGRSAFMPNKGAPNRLAL